MKLQRLLDSAFILLFSLGTKNVQAEYVTYGDKVYLQVNSQDNRWLSGARGAGNEGVITRDHLSSDYEINNVADTYRWIIQSVAQGNDYKIGTCLKYGDKIFLNNAANQKRWLSGGRGSGNEGVISRDHLGSDYEKKAVETYRWIVRSNLGTGSLSNDLSPDPAYGECVESLSLIYLQVNSLSNRWLSGGRSSGNEGVLSRNILGSDYERRAVQAYRWIVRKLRGNGDRIDALQCAAVSAKGHWVPLRYSNAPTNEISYTEGVERTSTTSFSQTTSWEVSVTSSISGGFVFGDASLEVGATYGQEMTSSVESAIAYSSTTTHTSTFGPGQIWQFVYEIRDLCVPSWDLKTKDLVVTESRDQYPCCLPGLAADADNQHGPCRLDSPCQCSGNMCDASSAPRITKACADVDFDAGFGGCHTYAKGAYNHVYCGDDRDLATDTKVEDVCSECGRCV